MEYSQGASATSSHDVRVVVLAGEPNWGAAVSRTIAGMVSPRPPACFTSLEPAKAFFRQQDVDLVFLDLNLEDSRGLATLREVRHAAPVAALVVMTTEQDEEQALEALRQGAQDYLVKGHEDSTVLRSTARFALERMRSIVEVHQWQHILSMTLDALPSGVALLDATGRVQMVNQAWKRMAESDNPLLKNCEVGANYLAICDALVNPAFAIHAVARGILQVLAGLLPRFSMEYAVPHAGGADWFELDITRFVLPRGTSIVVSNLDVTERHVLQGHMVLHEALHSKVGMEAGSLLGLIDVDGVCHFHQPSTLACRSTILDRFQSPAKGGELLAALFQTGSLGPLPVPMRAPDGQDAPYLLSGALLTGIQGEPPLALVVARAMNEGAEDQ